MTKALFSSVTSTVSQLIRWFVGGWSLERKSLLFLGVALVLPVGLAFWFVTQVVAEKLVMRVTQQSARDYAGSVVAWRHVEDSDFMAAAGGGAGQIMPGQGLHYEATVLGILRQQLVDNPQYRYEFLMLDSEVQHQELSHALRPENEREETLLVGLERRFRQQIAEREAAAKLAESELSTGEANAATPVDVDATNYFAPIDSVQVLFRDDGPVFPKGDAETPREGWYVYYHVVQFPSNCMICHAKYMGAQAEEIPFRVVKVKVPYAMTQVATTPTIAYMIAVGMVTVVSTLFVVHWVLRRLVLNPLQHLKHVSDEISRGNTNLRATIDTDDEFKELSDAFNRMMRHMTENQQKLRGLNAQLDDRIDQLAQANLKLYEANRLKSDFLANMSHELRTPLNSIIGFSDVLQGIESLSDKQRKYAMNIQKSGKLLLEMINDILDLAKVEAGKMNVVASSFELLPLVEAQCDMLRSLTDEKNMDLQIESSGEMEPVFQDQPKIQQILTNLLSNAIKFTPDGGVITVRLGPMNDNMFYITVSDTGVGIPEADFDVIFEKFRQSNAVLQNDGLTRQYSGTGLGLSIVKELCKLLGGEVRLNSQLGIGSSFQIILPSHYYEPQRSELVSA